MNDFSAGVVLLCNDSQILKDEETIKYFNYDHSDPEKAIPVLKHIIFLADIDKDHLDNPVR
jgi:hypothetical protein